MSTAPDMRPTSLRRWLLYPVALALVAAACGEGVSSTSTTGATTTTTEATTTTSETATTTTTEATTSTTEATTSTTEATTTTTTLAGEPIDIPGQAGDVFAVVGVAFNDVLNVREGPGTNYSILAVLDPLADNVVATGQERALTRTIWREVTVGGVTGWSNSSYLALLGSVVDDTSLVVSRLGGIPEAETMLELGQIVAETMASEEPRSRVTVTVDATVGDLGEVTYDVIGIGDDAVFGFRLHIFGQQSGEGFSLKSVETTVLCGRGVTDEGLCV